MSSKDSINCRCLGTQSNKFGTTYDIVSYAGNRFIMTKAELLRYIKSGKITVENIRVDSLDRVYIDEKKGSKNKNRLVLYHGQADMDIKLKYGLGQDKHDYGRGFYLTPNLELAKEWAVCLGNDVGYVHTFEVDTSNLKILDFDKENPLQWLAELMSHRPAADQKQYLWKSEIFIKKYSIDTQSYDIIKGWRADQSYFYIAKAFVRDEFDIDSLVELLKLGDLGVQYCLKQRRALEINTVENKSNLIRVDGRQYKAKYDNRDKNARDKMKKLIDERPVNVNKIFSALVLNKE